MSSPAHNPFKDTVKNITKTFESCLFAFENGDFESSVIILGHFQQKLSNLLDDIKNSNGNSAGIFEKEVAPKWDQFQKDKDFIKGLNETSSISKRASEFSSINVIA